MNVYITNVYLKSQMLNYIILFLELGTNRFKCIAYNVCLLVSSDEHEQQRMFVLFTKLFHLYDSQRTCLGIFSPK